ncbi:MAG: tRNA (adenosine(37)-N6)-threonylcarbamoyltransferase complex dimerization subunit type 1 TsaB [Cytophagales bacterium]|jgi:tRNA threonylcarbamoyladenosine biosynthesis protein TsaB|nr:tRNA (adenosine(37)-N6)-threonylcarbamoyltransferase complex dimerization subunit type 1 TsaB [Cytophagales bacterium]
MSLILSLETSSQNCSVALFDSGKILFAKKNTETFQHSQVLFPMIQTIFHELGTNIKTLDAVAISNGPGSFTGLRIGSAAALGICHALEIPLIAINTLESLIDKAKEFCQDEKKLFCPMIDARRREVYCMIKNFQNEILLQQQAKIIDAESFQEFDKEIICFGDGSAKCKEILKDNNKIKFLDNIKANATNLCRIAHEKFAKSNFDNILTYCPNYLK